MSNLDSIRIIPQTNRSEFLPPKPRRSKKWKWVILIVLILGSLGWGAFHFFSRTNQIFTNKGNIFSRFADLLVSPDRPLIGEDEGMINILLMGIGGEGHEGAHLTDTMIIASINTETNEVILTSIPRDFATQIPNVGFNKINAVYAYAYRDDPNSAGAAAIAAAEKITGFSIPYYAVIDFKGFVKAIDDVGGVDVVVDNTFTDATFPNDYGVDTKGYIAPVTFTKGPAHMNGRTALIFARSRHSPDANEGSDFARSERQKKILVALKNKVLALNLTKLNTINNLLSDFTNNFRTNLEPFELKRLVDLAGKIDSKNILSFSLDPDGITICSALVDQATGKPAPAPEPTPAEPTPISPTPPTPTTQTKPKTTTTTNDTNPPADQTLDTETPAEPEITRIYVVLPCVNKTVTDIQNYITNAPFLAKLKKEGAVISIQSSTHTPISPAKFKKLTDVGLDVRYITYAGKIAYDQTLIYDNSHGMKPQTFDYIKSNYNYVVSDITYPGSTADFVIILGKDQ